MQQIINWITENIILTCVLAAIVVLVIILLIAIFSGKKNNNKKETSCQAESKTCNCNKTEYNNTSSTEVINENTKQTITTEKATKSNTAEDNANEEDDTEVEYVDDDNPEDVKAAEKKEVTNIYHITLRKSDDKWQVKKQNSTKAIKLFDTQLEAITYAKTLAKNSEGSIRVHKTTGQIRKQW